VHGTLVDRCTTLGAAPKAVQLRVSEVVLSIQTARGRCGSRRTGGARGGASCEASQCEVRDLRSCALYPRVVAWTAVWR
jgi:hypothetical protein